MPINTTQRTTDDEIMDDFDMEGDVLRDALDKIATINQWLGGNKITLDGIQGLIQHQPKDREISIIDVGCGNGDMCRAIAQFARQQSRIVRIVGIDANLYTINYAKKLSADYHNVSYAVMNVFDEPFSELTYDVAVCTLTLHHFTETDILMLMRQFTNKARLGVVINDLQRSALAYRLFQLICFVFRLNPMTKADGLVSILRGFKRSELAYFSKQLAVKKYSITWRWAFRYQWIIETLCL